MNLARLNVNVNGKASHGFRGHSTIFEKIGVKPLAAQSPTVDEILEKYIFKQSKIAPHYQKMRYCLCPPFCLKRRPVDDGSPRYER
jgi:hypothetical protein